MIFGSLKLSFYACVCQTSPMCEVQCRRLFASRRTRVAIIGNSVFCSFLAENYRFQKRWNKKSLLCFRFWCASVYDDESFGFCLSISLACSLSYRILVLTVIWSYFISRYIFIRTDTKTYKFCWTSGLERCYVLVSYIAHTKGNDHRTAYWATQQGAFKAKNCYFLHDFISNFHIASSSPEKKKRIVMHLKWSNFFSHDNYLFNHSFIHLFIHISHSLIHSFIHLFIHFPFIFSSFELLTFFFINSFIHFHSFIYSFIHSVIHSFTLAFVHSLDSIIFLYAIRQLIQAN